MSIEEAIMGGIVFKGKKDKPQEDEKVKTCLLYTSPSPRD